MSKKPTYEELEQRVNKLENEVIELERKERELSKSRYYLDRITSGMYEGFMVIDRNFVIKDVNDRILKEYGRSYEEIIGFKCYEITHKVDRPCSGSNHLCPLNEVLKTGKPTQVEHIHKDDKGEKVFLEVYVFPLLGEDGNVEEIVEVSHDITDHKQAEQERMHRERLEAILEMAGAVCHDLNQPMQALMEFVPSLKKAISEDNPLYGEVQIIIEALDRMAEITRKIWYIERYETKEYIRGTRIVDIDKASRTK